MNWINIVISITGSTGIIILLLKYFGEKYIESKFQENLENHKQILNSKTEILKNDLSIYAHEQTTRFSRLDEKRTIALEEIFEMIYDIQKIVYDGMSFVQSNNEHIKNLDFSQLLTRQLSEKIRSLAYYRGKKRIYFHEELDELLSLACQELTKVREITFTKDEYQTMGELELIALQNTLLFKWRKVHEIYYANFEPLKIQITEEFRKYLGVL